MGYIDVDPDIDLTARKLQALFENLSDREVSRSSMEVLVGLACLHPAVRLSANVRTALSWLIRGENLMNGLLPKEHQVISELLQKDVENRDVRIALGLFNVRERQKLLRAIGRDIRRAKRSEAYLEIEEIEPIDLTEDTNG